MGETVKIAEGLQLNRRLPIKSLAKEVVYLEYVAFLGAGLEDCLQLRLAAVDNIALRHLPPIIA